MVLYDPLRSGRVLYGPVNDFYYTEKNFKQAKEMYHAPHILFFGNQNLVKFWNPEKVNVHLDSHSTTSHSDLVGLR